MIQTKAGTIIARANNVEAQRESFASLIGCDEVSAVAVAGAVGDWAAYMGPRGWSDEKIYSNGTKLFKGEAAEVFPLLSAAHYRS